MPLTVIPEGRRPAAQDALLAVFGPAPVTRIEPMTRGFSGAQVLRVEAEGRAVLLRLETGRDALRDPARHYACLAIAAEAGVAPPLLYANADEGVAVMVFIDARPFADYPGGAPAAALELAGLTARLRAAPRFPDLVDQLDGVDGLLQGVLATGVCAPGAIASHLAAWQALKAAYPRTPPERRVASHNDLNPNNILYDGVRLWLVDWETAFANDPLVDVASIALWFGVGDEEGLLRAAFGAVDETLRARFVLMRRVSQMLNGVLMLMLVAQTRPPGAPPIDDFTAPPFDQVRGGLATGAVDLGSLEGRALFAKASLNAVRDAVAGPDFAAAAKALA